MLEPTDQQLDEQIPEPEPEAIRYVDKLIMMDNGTLLIGRILLHKDADKFVYVFRPAEIWYDNLGTHMKPWIPESADEYFTIPVKVVTNITNPRKPFKDAYHNGFMNKKSIPVDPTTGEQITVFH